MTIHTIRLPDRLYGREPRTILWDDEAATVEGDHSDIPWMRERIADAPSELVNETCTIPLKDPGRDPRDFWHLILAAFYPAAREPQRSTMPAVLREVEPSELVMHPELTRWSRGEARWLGPCGHHSVSSPRSSNRTCGFPASGFPTGFTSKHTAVGQDGPDVVGSHRVPRTRPYRGNAWCLATTPCGRFRLRLDVELPPKAPELLGCRLDHRQSPLLAIIKSVPEVRALCSAGITRPHSSYGPVRRPR